MPTKIEPDEISICDNCGREFGFSTGVAIRDGEEVLFLCPDCYKEWNETHKPGR